MAVSPRSRSGKSPDFLKTYKLMCDQNDTGPLKRVMRHGQDRIVDVNIDNIRYSTHMTVTHPDLDAKN